MKIKFKDVVSMNKYKFLGQVNNKFLANVVGLDAFEVEQKEYCGQLYWNVVGVAGLCFNIHVDSEAKYFEIID